MRHVNESTKWRLFLLYLVLSAVEEYQSLWKSGAVKGLKPRKHAYFSNGKLKRPVVGIKTRREVMDLCHFFTSKESGALSVLEHLGYSGMHGKLISGENLDRKPRGAEELQGLLFGHVAEDDGITVADIRKAAGDSLKRGAVKHGRYDGNYA